MTEAFTAALTVLGGVVVFTLSQLILAFLVEPLREQAKVIGEILFGLVYYAREYANPGTNRPNERDAAENAFRRYASQLRATTHAVRCYRAVERWHLAPPRADVAEAVGLLIHLANSICSGDGRENRRDADAVERLLTLGREPEPATDRSSRPS